MLLLPLDCMFHALPFVLLTMHLAPRRVHLSLAASDGVPSLALLEALARLTEQKDDVIQTLIAEVSRLRKVQEEVLSYQGQSPMLARQLLFYESLKHKELPSPTLTWRGQEDAPTSCGRGSAARRAQMHAARHAAQAQTEGRLMNASVCGNYATDADTAPASVVAHSGSSPSPPMHERRGRTSAAADMSPRQAKVTVAAASASVASPPHEEPTILRRKDLPAAADLVEARVEGLVQARGPDATRPASARVERRQSLGQHSGRAGVL